MGSLASPVGMLATGFARNAGSNLRRKRAIRTNRGVSQQQLEPIMQFYQGAVPYATDSAQQYADSTAQLGNSVMGMFAGMPAQTTAAVPGWDEAAWTAANAAPTAPTLKDPSAIKFNALMPRGTRDSIRGKVTAKNEGKQAEYDSALAAYEENKAAAKAAADAAAAPGSTMPNRGEEVLAAYQTRQDEISAELDRLAAESDKGYTDRYTRNMAELEGRGAQAKKDIDKEFKASGGKIVAGAQNRGLYNTTVLSGMEAGNEASRIGEQGRLEDRLRGERIELDKELSRDQLESKSDLGKFKSLAKVQVTGETLRNMDDQRKQALGTMLQTGQLANEATRQVAATKLGLSEQFLRDVLDWYESQKVPVGEYAPLLDAVPNATAAYTQREAQREAERNRGFLGGSSDAGDALGLGFMASAGLGAAGLPGTTMGATAFDLMAANYFMGR
ncbi:MAG: hypothetical protein AB7I42_24315 [Bradyrhizobium sp.]|uniref:hypothetical protein n=1 Tax=Bradyrhizobium sp. TaxID=376 RepID=UPI003D149CCC